MQQAGAIPVPKNKSLRRRFDEVKMNSNDIKKSASDSAPKVQEWQQPRRQMSARWRCHVRRNAAS